MTKEENLQNFLENLKTNENIEAVILFGSHARGNSRPDSDIDLVVILKEGYKRAVEYHDDQAYEIIYTTEPAALKYWEEHKQESVRFWNIAKVLYGRNDSQERLVAYGAKLTSEKPPVVDESTRTHMQFDFEDTINAIERIRQNDPATAALLLHEKTSTLIDVFFDLRNEWRPAPKQQLQEIMSRESEIGELFEDFYTTEDFDSKLEIAKNIGVQIFK